MQIRHHRGALQTLPYGTIQSVKNRSRDWVISKLEFQVPHDTDILKVKKVIKALSGKSKRMSILVRKCSRLLSFKVSTASISTG